MGYLEVQQVLAKLYTNAVLRESFFANPQEEGEELGLSFDEAQQLAQLSAQQVNLFASSLKRKRLSEVKELLPLTSQVLGKDFSKLFWRYAETYLPQGIKKHWEDAIAFCTFIEKVAQVEGIEPPWVWELVRYEKACQKAAAPTCRLIWCRLRYALKPLVRSLVQQQETPVLLVQPTIALWFRARQGRMLHIVLSLPLHVKGRLFLWNTTSSGTAKAASWRC